MKRFLLTATLLLTLAVSGYAKDYIISTPNTSMILSAEQGKPLYFRYYGSRAEIKEVRDAGRMLRYDAYPAFGTRCDAPYAALVKQHDGDNAMKLVVDGVEKHNDGAMSTLSFTLRDVAHPTLSIKVNYSAYNDCDVIKTSTEYINEGKKPVVLQKYMSSVLPIQSDNCVLLHLDGSTKNEYNEVVEPLTSGVRTISTQVGSRVAQYRNASFMLGLDGRIDECRSEERRVGKEC